MTHEPSKMQRLEAQADKYFDDEIKATRRGDLTAAINLHRKYKKVINRQYLAIEDGEWLEDGDDNYEEYCGEYDL